MAKKRNPRELIESEKNPELESGYTKHVGKEIKDVSESRRRSSVCIPETGVGKYSEIHTHPINLNPVEIVVNGIRQQISKRNKFKKEIANLVRRIILPSYMDINKFLNNQNTKTSVIVGRDDKTGKIGGSFILKKTRKTPKTGQIDWDLSAKYMKADDFFEKRKYLNEIADEQHLQFRELDKNGRTISKYNPWFSRNLEIKSLTPILLFLSSLILISFKITGFTVYNISANSLSITGISLFFLSLILSFFFLRKKP